MLNFVFKAGNFDINNETGSITLEMMLDVETMSTRYYSLIIEARDGAEPPTRYDVILKISHCA